MTKSGKKKIPVLRSITQSGYEFMIAFRFLNRDYRCAPPCLASRSHKYSSKDNIQMVQGT